MTEKTPVEKIDEIYDMMHEMQKQLIIMDSNLKLLNSKVNGELLSGIKAFEVGKQPVFEKPVINKQIIDDLDAKPTIGVPIVDNKENKIDVPIRKTTIVQGKVLSDDGKPIPGVKVKIILPANKKVLAETKTNNAGLWTKFIGPGKYIIKYVHDTRPTQFRLIDVKAGMEKMTVE